MPIFDIYDQAVLTELDQPAGGHCARIRRHFLGESNCSRQSIRKVADGPYGYRAAVFSFGIGQFKAPNAMPALVEMPVTERREALIEMAQLEEMHRINSEQWMRLNSS
jgi:hypothetical protein